MQFQLHNRFDKGSVQKKVRGRSRRWSKSVILWMLLWFRWSETKSGRKVVRSGLLLKKPTAVCCLKSKSRNRPTTTEGEQVFLYAIVVVMIAQLKMIRTWIRCDALCCRWDRFFGYWYVTQRCGCVAPLNYRFTSDYALVSLLNES